MADDALALLRSRSYLVLLAIAAILGVPIAAASYWFLVLVAELQKWIFQAGYLPKWLGFSEVPIWWPIPIVGIAGLLVGLAIRYLPGKGGHSPADGFKAGAGAPTSVELPGVMLAALATLALGAVLGPEAPVIALGGGLALWAVKAAKPDAPARTTAVVAAAGSFAALSTLLGSPIVGAFFLMEAAGLGGPMMELVLIPGLLSAGVGSLVFIGLDSWTGHGTFALAIPNLPHVGSPDVGQFGWAIVIGVAAAVLGVSIRRLALFLRPFVDRRVVPLTVVAGLVVGALAVAFDAGSAKSSAEVLFSGQSALPSLLTTSATFSVATLVLLVVCKGLAYGVSLSAFRGGPTFPGMFIGAAGGLAFAHLPGLPPIAGAAMGIGAMTCVMLRLPLTAVLVTSIFLASDGVVLMPLVIVAVVVAYVTSAHLDSPESPPRTESAPSGAAPAATPVTAP